MHCEPGVNIERAEYHLRCTHCNRATDKFGTESQAIEWAFVNGWTLYTDGENGRVVKCSECRIRDFSEMR